jgi:formylglycine-generating enzyme required for sulfatase activity
LVYNPKIANHGRFAPDPLDDVDGFSELSPVASYPQGRTLEGVEDLAGNVEEWVADWYAIGYAEADMVDPLGPETGDERVVRGGSYLSGRAWLRSGARDKDLPSRRKAWRGFRCAAGDNAPKIPD